MLEELREIVYQANMQLVENGLVIFTWGNVSGIDRESGLVVIKPSGVEYSKLKPKDLVVVDLDGNTVEGENRPSSDTATHIELYKAFPDIGGVVHTHSYWATSWCQAQKSLIAYGTTHADYFYGTIPCTRKMNKEEIINEYEKNTGKVIVETFKELDENAIPGVLCASHGPFSWGTDALEAVHNATVLEEIAKMAFYTKQINPDIEDLSQDILDKHYYRKHGANSYYGQK